MNVSEFVDKMLSVFPEASWDIDNDNQVIVYTNLQYLTSEDNPTIAEGETLILPFVPDCGDPGPDCVEHNGECD